MLTQARLKEVLHYDPETGVFIWKSPTSNRFNNIIKMGTIAGFINNSGYQKIGIDGCQYYAHRLAFLYMINKSPINEIDHINGIRHDNRFTNLRDVNKSENGQNQNKSRKGSATGYLGVSYFKRVNKYVAGIYVKGRRINLGYFKTAEEAHEAYLIAKRIHHPACSI